MDTETTIFLISLVPGTAAILVYLDAVRHGIGKIPDQRGMLNMSAGGWSIAVLLLLILALPLYLIKRRKLIARAAQHPVRHTYIPIRLLALLAASLYVASSISQYAVFKLPECRSAEVQQLLPGLTASLKASNPLARIQTLAITKEITYLKEKDERICEGTITSAGISATILLRIFWLNKPLGKYYIQIDAQKPNRDNSTY